VSRSNIPDDANCSCRLDKLYKQLTQRQRALDYPINRNFDYKPLFKFLEFPLNNIGDPSTKNSYILHSHDIEQKVIQIFKQLTGGASQEVWGYITNGGTEGNIHGLHTAREIFPDGIVYYSEASHYSVSKALRLLRVHSIMIRCQCSGEIDYEDLQSTLKLYKDRPAIVVANIGTVMKGAIDSITAIRMILEQLGIAKYYIHCDAALSGMILPFVDSAQPFGFQHGADSISISGYKLIGSPIPCGVVLIKRKNLQRPEWIEYSGILDTTLTGSRSGFVPLILWYALTSVGRLKAGELTVKT
jgi:histidine decarboxylase